jgi:hypothetical protein
MTEEIIQKKQYWVEFISFSKKHCNYTDEDLAEHIVKMVEKAINYTHSCTELVCVDDGDLPNLTQDNIYKMIVESNKHYNIIDDNGNDVLISKKYLTKTT